jgi:FkbM family methyltransferase
MTVETRKVRIALPEHGTNRIFSPDSPRVLGQAPHAAPPPQSLDIVPGRGPCSSPPSFSEARSHRYGKAGLPQSRELHVKGPVYAGADRALARLASGEYICVDTNSLDAIDYLLGWDMEVDVLPVFRSFLEPDSVVLDIGANFGLYTAISATSMRDRGRLYSFEANPHTFDLLKRTLYANRLAHRPNVTAVNALVGETAGRGSLHYLPEFLGGATMTDVGQWGKAKRSIELDIITIDEFLPAGLAVDLVKIDVEGHEPFVIRGMQQTIRRSPNIRIFIEFVEAFLSHTVSADRFAAEIEGLGLRICRVLSRSGFELIERGQTPRGANFCLLTRTPEEDIAHAQRAAKHLPARVARYIRRLEAGWDRYRRALHRR